MGGTYIVYWTLKFTLRRTKLLTSILSLNPWVLVTVYVLGKLLKATSVYTAFDALAGGHVLLAPFLFYLMLLVAAFFITTQKAWKVRLSPQQVRLYPIHLLNCFPRSLMYWKLRGLSQIARILIPGSFAVFIAII